MKNVTKTLRALWNDESAQGATEYILLLVVVVAIGMVFKNQIMKAVNDKLGSLTSDIQGFKGEGG